MPNNPTNGPTKKPDNDIENGFGRVLNAELSIGFSDVSRTLTSFAFISLMSVLIGVGFGLISSFICKNVPTLKIHPAREVFLILLVAYLSYVVSEMLFLSGIMTIFC